MNLLNAQDTLIILGFVVIYIIATGILSVKLSGKSNEDFMTGSSKMPTFVIAVLIMSEFIGAMSTIGTAQQAFSDGMAAMWAILAAVVGFILYGLFFVKKLYQTGGFTISSAIEKQYGRSTRLIVSLIMIFALILINANSYISGASVLAEILGMKLPLAMIIIGIVSTVYFCIGGMKSVAWITLIHTTVKYIGILIITVVALMMTHGIHPVTVKLPSYYFTFSGHVGITQIIGWIITITGAIFSTQFIVQAISSAKSAKSAQKASFEAALMTLPLGIMVAVIGVCARYLFPKLNSLYALTIFLRHMNVFFAAVVAIGLLASVFVGVSATALAIVSLVVDDFYVPHWHPTAHKQLKMTRFISIIVGFLPMVFAFMTPNILGLSFFTKAIRVSITFVALIAFYMPFFTDTLGADVALIGTTILSTVWYVLKDPFGISDLYVALFSPILILILWKPIMWLYSHRKKA